ncbi:hypothetical protein [Erwinia rhapontici]|uniref:hypothetical protein n=1 Tax=Erwinia rhapontici TaxID=55212 RepID=UPI003BA005F2
MKKIIVAGFAAFAFSASVQAVHLDSKYPVCVSQDSFERLMAIIKHKDRQAFDEIMQSECLMLKRDLPVDKIVSLDGGVGHVKVYTKGDLLDLWTNSENVKLEEQ